MVCNLFHCRQQASFRQTEKKILDSILGESPMGDYDSRIRPSGIALNDTADGAGE